jgi:hypothetical protein
MNSKLIKVLTICRLLTTRLDQYGDGWRTAPQPHFAIDVEQKEATEKPETKPLSVTAKVFIILH